MSLDQIISISISRRTTQPSRAGFGTPLIAAYFSSALFSDRVRSYSSLSAMEDDGFKAADPAYLQAQAIFAQNPSPASVKVGRRANAPQQVTSIAPDAPTLGQVHEVTVTGYADGTFSGRTVVTDTATLTITTETDEQDVADALRIALTAPSGDFTPTTVGTGASATLVITADNSTMDGLIFGVTYTVDGIPRGMNDNTADPGLATDLGAIYDYDPDWYGLCLDSNSAAEIDAAAGWVASNKKILVAQTRDPDVANVAVASDTTSIAATLKSDSRTQTMLFFHTDNLDFVSGAMLGRILPTTPGSATWAYKQLSGIAAQQLTDNQLGILQASVSSPTGGKDVNTVTSLNQISITRYGSSMQGEFMDVQRYADYLEARLQEDIYGALVNNDKIPLTDAGINAISGVVYGRLEEGVSIGALTDDPAPEVEAPRASDLTQSERNSRWLNGMKFRAQLAGAAHFVSIAGELT